MFYICTFLKKNLVRCSENFYGIFLLQRCHWKRCSFLLKWGEGSFGELWIIPLCRFCSWYQILLHINQSLYWIYILISNVKDRKNVIQVICDLWLFFSNRSELEWYWKNWLMTVLSAMTITATLQSHDQNLGDWQ